MIGETPNNRLVEKAWGSDAEYVYDWWIEEDTITDLRFIIRDGQRILQAKYKVHVVFSEPVIRPFEYNVTFEKKRIWLDVPLKDE